MLKTYSTTKPIKSGSSRRRKYIKQKTGIVIKSREDLDRLSALWPGDEEPEELLNFILEDRKQRRETQKHN